MGRSRLVNSFQPLGRIYSHRLPIFSVKHSDGWSKDPATLAASEQSCSISADSGRGNVSSQDFSAVESSRRNYLTEQISTRRIHVSASTAPDRLFYNSQFLKHPSSVITSLVARAGEISVTFVDKDGDETTIKVPVGMSMLEAAHENDIELEGACEGSLACSTCHVIVMDEDVYGQLPEPTDEENDMLDLAFGLTETSRLGCQVIAQPELDGLRLALPAATRNFAVDGHVPKPH
ncbi:hypothetical protein AXG93_3891s1030 [Marchantia polymorpha subsp. ruderalis]|uniref:2Fe-2S ferredoxin n=1 Tax=Marchantia polymorpha subsp. ruderalis TaxID=1480154 RepID=A0A176WLF4_MARPO|nr:hypothetical protein AXG93_3891s1030 [Marchantia polymorpha subsp. ruderalis]